MISVVLADDHAVVAEGLGALLEEKYTLLRTVHDGRALVAAVAELNPDVVITDISMPLLNGLDASVRSRPPVPRPTLSFSPCTLSPILQCRRFGPVHLVIY